MEKVVVILAEPDDIHALAVRHEVTHTFRSECVILDTRRFPASWALNLSSGGDEASRYGITTGDREIHSECVAGVWLRRTRTHAISGSVTDARVRRFCVDESRAALQGWLYSLGPLALNPLAAELAANRKPYQLHLAARVGLRVPRTLITNSPEHARRFNTELGQHTIFKILGAIDWCFLETRAMQDGYEPFLDALEYAPVIFQERIDGVEDVRVTIVDDRLFTVGIKARHPGAAIDWRLDLGAEIRPHELPDDVAARLLDLMRALGLRFGAIDLRLTAGGDYVFFEVNPAGQFLFAEIHGHQPICRALAGSLLAYMRGGEPPSGWQDSRRRSLPASRSGTLDRR